MRLSRIFQTAINDDGLLRSYKDHHQPPIHRGRKLRFAGGSAEEIIKMEGFKLNRDLGAFIYDTFIRAYFLYRKTVYIRSQYFLKGLALKYWLLR